MLKIKALLVRPLRTHVLEPDVSHQYHFQVGCSYEDQDCEMQAGKHDVKAVEKFIKDNFDWSATRVLHEDAPSHRQPTRENIHKGFKWLVSTVQWDKDHLFFYFAGHGELKNGVSQNVEGIG
ncbi:hypothetical protein B0H14DRAFT_2562611 [Mycena olivaceomarginata]|nr:hypothetical protein B0H14DRAFT_2562611 [Mycena olivaceomarginata]